jgi:anti-sigma factor RsiW
MNRTCSLLDRYRDGELEATEQSQFESHMAGCDDCRSKMSLLDNVVYSLKQDEVPVHAASPERVARLAFQRGKSWDILVVSWLRPLPAYIALVLALIVFSFLWLVPDRQQIDAYSEYEVLANETDALSPGGSGTQIHNDSDLMIWLEQEGNSQ